MNKRIRMKINSRIYKGFLVHMWTLMPLPIIQRGWWKILHFAQRNHQLINQGIWKTSTTRSQLFTYVKHLYQQMHHVKYTIYMPKPQSKHPKTWTKQIMTESANKCMNHWFKHINNITIDFLSMIVVCYLSKHLTMQKWLNRVQKICDKFS